MLFRKKRDKLSGINPNDKINYNKNDLLDELHARFFQSYSLTLDTADYIPQTYIQKVYKQLYKAQKAMYRKIGKTDKDYQKWFREQLPVLLAERQQQLLQAKLQNKDGKTDEQKGQ